MQDKYLKRQIIQVDFRKKQVVNRIFFMNCEFCLAMAFHPMYNALMPAVIYDPEGKYHDINGPNDLEPEPGGGPQHA